MICLTPSSAAAVRPLLLTLGLSTLIGVAAQAQSYTLIDLTPAAGNATAVGLSEGAAAGSTANGVFGTLSHAMVWSGDATVDLHPAGLDDQAAGVVGRSAVLGFAGGVQVGWGSGVSTGNRPYPMIWRGAAETATLLPIPFTNFGGQATATDGVQVGGFGIGLDKDGLLQGPAQAMVWDAATGAAVSLGDGGNASRVNGVAAGQQVGQVVKGQTIAVLWRGTRQSQVSLHPRDAVVSVANATDGTRQVGYAGYDIRVRQEAAKGNKTARFNYAMLWTGSAASAQNIHPYPMNSLPGVVLSHSYALGMNAQWIVGYAGDQTKFGTPAYSHAIVWNANLESIDLNAFLPEGYVGAQAIAVDAAGNVAGLIAKADGTRHAAVWIRNPAE